MKLKLEVKPFSFHLLKPIQTSQGVITRKEGWLIKLQDQDSRIGWGEISPINSSELTQCKKILTKLGSSINKENLENQIKTWPGPIGFAFGAALAEINLLIGDHSEQRWLQVSSSAVLLPNNELELLKSLDSTLENQYNDCTKALTFKWKVANYSNEIESVLLQKILKKLPHDVFLRIDANCGWTRSQAKEWAQELHQEPRLEWLEQPLPADDIEGLEELAQYIPVALDESLIKTPSLRQTWKSWQIRRPLLEGDPRILLKELTNKTRFRVISTSFETGIGRRWVEHLAALQQKTSTPTQPGLAPGWLPISPLFNKNPKTVWEAA